MIPACKDDVDDALNHSARQLGRLTGKMALVF